MGLGLPPGDTHLEMTLDYYDEHGRVFAAGTLGLDMGAIYARFLPHVPVAGSILDAGCGSGRDARAFLDRGYRVAAFDGSARMATLASEHTGLAVRTLTFAELDDVAVYDGVWACASLLHVPLAELGGALGNLVRATRPGGVIYVSFKYGVGERLSGGRHFVDFTPEGLRGWLVDVPGVELVDVWLTGDVREGRGDERWTNGILRVAD